MFLLVVIFLIVAAVVGATWAFPRKPRQRSPLRAGSILFVKKNRIEHGGKCAVVRGVHLFPNGWRDFWPIELTKEDFRYLFEAYSARKSDHLVVDSQGLVTIQIKSLDNPNSDLPISP
jgi:hypothetical protein